MYFRSRYYDSTTGEFASRDPMEYVDGMSLYRGYFLLSIVDTLGLKTFRAKVVAKSFINGIPRAGAFILDRAGIGSLAGVLFDLPDESWVNWTATERLRFLAKQVAGWGAFNQNPLTDAKDQSYRLYTKVDLKFDCCGNKLTAVRYTKDKDGGIEFVTPPVNVLIGGTIDPPDIYGTINLTNLRAVRVNASSVDVSWLGWGRPSFLVPGMQWVALRTSVNIWHRRSVRFVCKNGRGSYNINSFKSSRFPSHKLWINGGRWKRHIVQGSFSDLWNAQTANPTFVK